MKTIKNLLVLTMIAASTMGMSPLSEVSKTVTGANQLLCTITINGSTAVSTSSNGACNWTKGQKILMQCKNTSVYINSTTINGTLAAATTAHQRVDFNLGVTDPINIQLLSNDQAISVLGTGAGTCDFYLGNK